jgi:hypothetical protein
MDGRMRSETPAYALVHVLLVRMHNGGRIRDSQVVAH